MKKLSNITLWVATVISAILTVGTLLALGIQPTTGMLYAFLISLVLLTVSLCLHILFMDIDDRKAQRERNGHTGKSKFLLLIPLLMFLGSCTSRTSEPTDKKENTITVDVKSVEEDITTLLVISEDPLSAVQIQKLLIEGKSMTDHSYIQKIQKLENRYAENPDKNNYEITFVTYLPGPAYQSAATIFNGYILTYTYIGDEPFNFSKKMDVYQLIDGLIKNKLIGIWDLYGANGVIVVEGMGASEENKNPYVQFKDDLIREEFCKRYGCE